jgi:tetratricopeptide (TPR) repeat protein
MGETRDLSKRRNFSVRLPEPLYEALESMSRRTKQSMNHLVGEAIAHKVEKPDLTPAPPSGDVNAQIAKDAIQVGPEAIGPLKGIAKHLSNRGQMVLACVVWTAAARLVLQQDGRERASAELAMTARRAEESGKLELALGLYTEALSLDPENLECANRLGQRYHHQAQHYGDDVERYRKAKGYLDRVREFDNHAKIFHGWAVLHVARHDGDGPAETEGLREIIEAMRSWAFGQRDGMVRGSWLRQVRRLCSAGLEKEARALADFANRNALWTRIDESDLVVETRPPSAPSEPVAPDRDE